MISYVVDGAIDWGPNGPLPVAEGFDIQARKADVYDWVRQVRGGILAGAFTIESNLNKSIILFFLGRRMAITEVREAFESGVLDTLSFDRRISLTTTIGAALLDLDGAAEMKATLNDLRTLRNAMAHNPFWFHPESDAAGKIANIVPVIMRGKQVLPLTTAFVEGTNTKISGLIRSTAELAEKVRDYAMSIPS